MSSYPITSSVTRAYDKEVSAAQGLSSAEVLARRAQYGPNEISVHKTKISEVLARQLNNPILWLLIGALVLSGALGDITNALIIAAIVSVSIGLGFLTEYRAERATDDLHTRIEHHATVIRDGIAQSIFISELVPGDVVLLRVGSVIPADISCWKPSPAPPLY